MGKKNTAQRMTTADVIRTKNEKKETNACSITGLTAGTLLCLISGYNALCAFQTAKIIYTVIAAAGVLLFLCAAFAPSLLAVPVKYLGKFGNRAGTFIIRLILLPAYIFIMLLSLIFGRKARKGYEFFAWNDENEIPVPSFSAAEESSTKKKNSLFGTLNRLSVLFSGNGMTYLVPVVIFLIIIGLIFFFLSANSVFVFIYTLF